MSQKLYPKRCPNCGSTAIRVNEVDRKMRCDKCGYISVKGIFKANYHKIRVD